MWQRIWKGVTAYFSVTIITNISGVLQAILTINYLPVAEYGRLTLLLSFFSTARVLFDLGSRGIFISEIAKAQGESCQPRTKGLITVYSRFVLITTAIPTLLFIGIAWRNRDFLFGLLALYIFLYGYNNGLRTILLSHTKYKQAARQQSINSLTRLGLLLSIPFWNHPAILLTVLLTYPAKELMALVFSVKWVYPIINQLRNIKPEKVDFLFLFKEQGVYTVLSYPIRKVIGELPIWLLRILLGETAVGLYGVAQKALGFILIPFAYIEELLFPLVPEQMTQNISRIRVVLRQTQKYSFWLMLTAVTITFISAPWFIRLIAGPEYQDAILILRWLLPTLLLTPFLQLHRPILFALKQQKTLLFIRVLKFITYAPLLTYFISTNGVIGAAQAIVLDGILHLFTRWILIRKVAPEFWVSPITIFKIESFDTQLWQKFATKIKKQVNG